MLVVVVFAGGDAAQQGARCRSCVLTLPSLSVAVMSTAITALVALSLGGNEPLNGPTVPEYSSSTFESGPLSRQSP